MPVLVMTVIIVTMVTMVVMTMPARPAIITAAAVHHWRRCVIRLCRRIDYGRPDNDAWQTESDADIDVSAGRRAQAQRRES